MHIKYNNIIMIMINSISIFIIIIIIKIIKILIIIILSIHIKQTYLFVAFNSFIEFLFLKESITFFLGIGSTFNSLSNSLMWL